MLENLKYLIKLNQEKMGNLLIYPSLILSLLILFHLGYNTDPYWARVIDKCIEIGFYLLFIVNSVFTLSSLWAYKKPKIFHFTQLGILIYFALIILVRMPHTPIFLVFEKSEWLYLGIFFTCLMQLSNRSLVLENLYFNPTILFVISFLTLILLGTFLLMLPKTVVHEPLGFVDAFFMATSAISITGLTVVDISTEFTIFGKSVILILIQLGALGIMTFSGFFGYFFSGGFSFKNQLMFGEFIGQGKIASVINTLLKIIFVTLGVECLGALIIYFNTSPTQFESFGDQVFFSVFHAVSAFCNAGFSIIEGGFQNAEYKFNYNLQLILTVLFILGGTGFMVLFNFWTFIKRFFLRIWCLFSRRSHFIHKPWVMSFNSRLILWATLVLASLSSLSFFLLESQNTLSEHSSEYGKIVSSLFMGNSSRTSGFSSVDLNQVSYPMLALMLFFMWVGASPGSTGGGIKTTTLFVAILNVLSLAKGKENVEIFKRTLPKESLNKAFAIIILSFLVMGISFFLLSITDGEKGFKPLVIEVFSAYATCGLGMGITPELSQGGKVVITFTMFIGRVGMLTLLVAFIKDIKVKKINYPEEKILY